MAPGLNRSLAARAALRSCREEIVGAPEELESSLARQGLSTAHLGERLSQSAGLRSGFSGGAQDASVSPRTRLTHPEKARVAR